MRRTVVALLAWLLATTATLTVLGRTTEVQVDPDEIYWIGSAYYYHLAFEQGDWRGANPDWKLLPARENPPVAKYAFGLGLALAGLHVPTLDGLGSFYAYFASILGAPIEAHAAKQREVMKRMDPALYEDVSRTRQMYIAPPLLLTARRVALACGIITSLLVYFFGVSTSGYATGFLASQLILVHPAVKFAYDHAMADAVGYMFGTAAALAIWFYSKSEGEVGERAYKLRARPRASLSLCILSGALIGLAVATKMNWLTVAFLFAATVSFVAITAWRRGDRLSARRAVVHGLLGSAIAFAVFVIVNPTIISDPIAGLIATVREPQLTTVVQARVLTTQTYLAGIGAKLVAVANLTTGLSSPYGTPIFVALLAGAAFAMFRAPRPGFGFAAAWWAIAFVCVTAWIPFEWKRYALPVVIPFALLVSHAAVAATRLVLHRRQPAGDASVAI